jgi:hypothetical protein
MRYFIIILSVCFSTRSISQNSYKENFLNAIYKVAVDTTFPYYILSEEADPFNKYREDDIIKNLHHILPDSVIRQLFTNSSIDTLFETWDCNKLSKVQCVPEDSIEQIVGPSLLKFTAPSVYENPTSKSHKAKKQLRHEAEQWEKTPLYKKSVYHFSRPVFDNKKEYAMISMSYECGMLCGFGCKYFFKLIDAKWTLITTMQCWIS